MTVDDRTKTVRREVEQARLPPGFDSTGERLRLWRPEMPSLDIDGATARAVQVAKSAWWVPAGIGILVLLNAILAG